MKFIAKLKGFQSYTDLEAKLTNKSGKKIIGSVSEEEEFNGKFVFKFSKDDLPGKKKDKKSKLKLTIESLNTANETNLTSADVNFTFEPSKQSDKFKISRSKNKSSKFFSILAKSVAQPTGPDTTPPAFTSSDKIDSVQEGSAQGTVIYTATSTDDSPPVTYSLSGSDAENFDINPNTGVVTTKTDLNHSAKSNYEFNVVATDSEGNAASLTLELNILPAGVSITKVVGKNLEPNNPLTAFNDTISCPVGSLLEVNGEKASITDGNKEDKDTVIIDSDGRTNLEDVMADALFTNIEDFQINANQDESTEISLATIVNGNSLKFSKDSTFKKAAKLTGWGLSAITYFDFSELTSTFGIDLLNADSGAAESKSSLSVVGSNGLDRIEALAGDADIKGYEGTDNLVGSTGGQSTLNGGGGVDTLVFPKTDVQNTIDITGQKTSANRDVVTGYVGFNNATATDGSFDLIRIDTTTFSNYEPDSTIKQMSVAEALDADSLLNTVIVDTNNNLDNQLFTKGGKGLLAFETDTQTLRFAPAGNFIVETEQLLLVDSADFSATNQLQVVA